MTDRDLLLSRILGLRADLNKAATLPTQIQDQKLAHRVEIRFKTDFDILRIRLRTLLENLPVSGPLEDAWNEFAEISSLVAPMLSESFALAQGAWARAAGLDDGICEIADKLLYRLSWMADIQWRRFTVLADSEYVDETASIIRVRFPEATIWDLPFAAHELGHFIGPRIEVTNEAGDREFPLPILLADARAAEQQYGLFLMEHFADVFAVYAVGPMFVFASIVLRFDPLTAFEEEGPLDTHPSGAKRVHIILRTLRALDGLREAADRQYEFVGAQLAELWQSTLRAAGIDASLDDDLVNRLDTWHDSLFDIVSKLPSLRYDGWDRAKLLAGAIGPSKEPPPQPDAVTSVADVLNAAWVARMARPDADISVLRRISDKAVAMCCMIPMED